MRGSLPRRVSFELYKRHPDILRTRDIVSGEIGEYFAIRELNRLHRDRPVIRLSGGEKDIDAIQVGNGRRFAIKTIGKPYQTTSNIWSRDPKKAVDQFVVVHLDTDALKPNYIVQISSGTARTFMRRDTYQGGTRKLRVTRELIDRSKLLFKAPGYRLPGH